MIFSRLVFSLGALVLIPALALASAPAQTPAPTPTSKTGTKSATTGDAPLEEMIPGVCFEAQDAAEPEQGIKLWTNCLNAKPGKQTKVVALYNRGLAQMALDKPFEAIKDYTAAAKITPQDSDIYVNRGYAYLQLAKYDEAISDFTRALAFSPRDADARVNRAVARAELGKYEDALHDYEEALLNDPGHIAALRGLAFILAACDDRTVRDGRRAVEVAIRLTNLERTADTLETQAAAHAEAQQFPQAIAAQKEAIALAEAAGESTAHLKHNLERYKSHKAYR